MNNDLKKELRSKTFGYVSGALGLVAGLAWNDAISNMIETLFPLSKDAIWMKFVYAIIITVAVVVVILYLERMINKPEPNK